MTEIPADAPRSEDGHYWWDGSAWQLIDQAAGGQSGGAAGASSAAGAAAGSSAAEQPAEQAPVAPPVIAANGVPGAEAIAPDVEIA